MNRRKRRRRNSKLFLFIILLIFCVLLYFVIFTVIKSGSKENLKVVDEISEFGYSLEKRDSQLMKDKFSLLKKELGVSDIDYEKYAEYLSELFVIDLYTISNKKSKYDVGGVEYVVDSYKDSYTLKVQDSLYRYLKSGKNSSYPIVKDVSLVDISEDLYELDSQELDAYVVKLNWTYKDDSDYDDSAQIILVKEGKKLSVAKFVTEGDD